MQYACLDAFAFVLVYLEIERLKDPIRCPAPTTLPPGTQVRVRKYRMHEVLHHPNRRRTRRIGTASSLNCPHSPNLVYFVLKCLVRLYSNHHASCVRVGAVQDDETAAETLDRWRPQPRRTNLQKRVVVKVSEALKPSAYTAHKGAPTASAGVGRVTMKDDCDDGGDRLVL